MRCRSERIFGAEREVPIDYALASAVGQDQIVAGNQCAKRIGRRLFDAVERGRRVDIPEEHALPWLSLRQYGCLQELIEYADTAGLDHDLGVARPPQSQKGAWGSRPEYTTTVAHGGSSMSRCCCRSYASGS